MLTMPYMNLHDIIVIVVNIVKSLQDDDGSKGIEKQC